MAVHVAEWLRNDTEVLLLEVKTVQRMAASSTFSEFRLMPLARWHW